MIEVKLAIRRDIDYLEYTNSWTDLTTIECDLSGHYFEYSHVSREQTLLDLLYSLGYSVEIEEVWGE